MYEAPSSCSPGLRASREGGPHMRVAGGAQMPHKPHSPRGCSVFYVWSAPRRVFLTCPHMYTHRLRPGTAPLLGAGAWLPTTPSAASFTSVAPAACTGHSQLPLATNPNAHFVPSFALCAVWVDAWLCGGQPTLETWVWMRPPRGQRLCADACPVGSQPLSE